MYFLMYLAVIKLRYSQPNTVRKFQIPGGKLGVWLVAGWGFIAMVGVFLIALLPPSQVAEDPTVFEIFMVVGTVLVTAVPLVIYKFRRPSWKPVQAPVDAAVPTTPPPSSPPTSDLPVAHAPA